MNAITREPSPALPTEEIERMTGYRQPAAQLAALHKRGFFRAYRNAVGAVVLERPHFDAVSAGIEKPPAANEPQLRPRRQRCTA